MRIPALVVALLVTLAIPAAAQAPGHSRLSTDRSPSKSSGYPGKANADSSQTTTANPDPYRYYSHSEGWTYYNLPPSSSAPPHRPSLAVTVTSQNASSAFAPDPSVIASGFSSRAAALSPRSW